MSKREIHHGPPSRMKDPSFHNLAPDVIKKMMFANGFKHKKKTPDIWYDGDHLFELPNTLFCSYTCKDRHEKGDWAAMVKILKERPDFRRSKPKKNAKVAKQGHPAVLFDYGKWLAGEDGGLEKVLLSFGYKHRILRNTSPDKVVARYHKRGHSFIQVRSDGKYRLNSSPVRKDGKVKYEPKSFIEISRDDLVLFVKS